MDHLLSKLDESHRVLDLGCGAGSLDYPRYRCLIYGLDFSFPPDSTFESRRRLPNVHFLRGLSHQLPFVDGALDVVICNNTLEHFQEIDLALAEITRVTHEGSQFYAAVPNGFGFDDALYRFLSKGGGHLNRFSFEGLRSKVEAQTRFRLRSFRRLFSSFIYLNRPRKEILVYLPRRIKLYYYLGPQWLVSAGMLALNQLVRWVDLIFGTCTSQYGWAFYFQTEAGPVKEQAPNVNVCMGCGAGHSEEYLRQQRVVTRGWPKFYRCPSCSRRNLFF